MSSCDNLVLTRLDIVSCTDRASPVEVLYAISFANRHEYMTQKSDLGATHSKASYKMTLYWEDTGGNIVRKFNYCIPCAGEITLRGEGMKE